MVNNKCSNAADELFKSDKTSRLGSAELAQPLCTAVQIGLFNKLARCNIRPDAVIGHSSGEIAAAYASGVLSMSAALILAYYRGYVTKAQTKVGGMAALGLDLSTALKYLEDGVVIACENSPTSVTVSGDLDKVQNVVANVQKEKPDVLARALKVDMAYHSRKCSRPRLSELWTKIRRSHEASIGQIPSSDRR